jgi:hypothetical protein
VCVTKKCSLALVSRGDVTVPAAPLRDVVPPQSPPGAPHGEAPRPRRHPSPSAPHADPEVTVPVPDSTEQNPRGAGSGPDCIQVTEAGPVSDC